MHPTFPEQQWPISRRALICSGIVILSVLWAQGTTPTTAIISAADYNSLQDAINANPGQRIFVPSGDYNLTSTLRIQTDGTGLYGYGRLVQQNPAAEILRVDDAKDVRIFDLTLTRPPAKQDASEHAIQAVNCVGLEISGVRVYDNHFGSGAVLIRHCSNATIRDCTVQNYKTITIDDRTHSPEMNYAFKCIDGTGIQVSTSTGTLVLNNRILEHNLLPTKENQVKYELGKATIIPAVKGSMTPDSIYQTGYTNNWHQGSGLIASNGGRMHNTLITGNYIENAAQGMDIHSDQVTVANNIVFQSMMGMKAIHGSRNTLIHSNLFSHPDLWGIALGPGTASGPAQAATPDAPALEANVDGASVVAHNIIGDFGHGGQFWNWDYHDLEGSPLQGILLGGGVSSSAPPLRDVLVRGNIVYNSENENAPATASSTTAETAPNYRYAVKIDSGDKLAPVGMRLDSNILNPGRGGSISVELPY